MRRESDEDIEKNCSQEEGSSRTVIDEYEILDLKYFSKELCDLIQHNKSESFWRQARVTMSLRDPMGNSILHIAALYGNDECAKRCLQNLGPYNYGSNENDDTALHVAARAGHMFILEMLVCRYLHSISYLYPTKPKEALDTVLKKNKQGNTFFHEAILNCHRDVMKILDSTQLQIDAGFKELLELVALFWTNNEERSVLHLAIEKGYNEIVEHALAKLITQPSTFVKYIENNKALAKMIPGKLSFPDFKIFEADVKIMDEWKKWSKFRRKSSSRDKLKENRKKLAKLIPYGPYYIPPGISPLILAISKRQKECLQTILTKKEEWIYLMDDEGRTAFHYAASIGYLEGVEKLLATCVSSQWEKDMNGLFPLHLASAGGHLEVVKKLVENYPYPRQMVDKYGRNIVHIAAEIGKLNVVTYILQNANHELVDMINDKDMDGNTPLHLATLHCQPKFVHTLTWDRRVDLSSVNRNNQTALDVYMQNFQENPPLRQRLTWIALKSAGAKYAERGSHSVKDTIHSNSEESDIEKKGPSMDFYKDRINTLMLVSTLITTVTFAAGFTLPGGLNSSSPGLGMAIMLNHVWFKPFIFCITISMYGGIGVTIILIWAQLGDTTLSLLALKMARPLLGMSLATLSVAFMAGVHLVISDLSWLATTFLVLCVICVVMLLLLYTILWFPSSSSNSLIRYISYYPFLFLIWLDERRDTEGLLANSLGVIDHITHTRRQNSRGGYTKADADGDEREEEEGDADSDEIEEEEADADGDEREEEEADADGDEREEEEADADDNERKEEEADADGDKREEEEEAEKGGAKNAKGK